MYINNKMCQTKDIAKIGYEINLFSAISIQMVSDIYYIYIYIVGVFKIYDKIFDKNQLTNWTRYLIKKNTLSKFSYII